MSFSAIIKDIIHQGLENVVGRYYSSYRGYVFNNEDPENLNRLQILVPHLNPDIPDETWAYSKNQFSGKGYGIHVLPKNGDLVWVEYEFGNLDYPLWSFAHYGEEEKPEEFDSVNKFGFKTPRGSIVLFNDTEDEESISIKLKDYKDIIEINLDLLKINSKVIQLGKEELEWLAKGEKTQEKIEELWDELKTLAQALVSHNHAANGAAPPNTTGNISTVISNITSKKSLVKEILSKKIKVE